MQTTHEVHVGDARDLDLPADSVDLVVTSPPYPMVEIWDDSFAAQSDAVATALEAGDGDRVFDAMHDTLDAVWRHLPRVLRPGGVAIVNVGDATRTLDRFRQYPNAAEITSRLRAHGLDPLPDILWRKPANSAAKFMGSGTLPTNAYATLEHEHLLVFRNGDTREFPPGDETRYESAYFYEERNEWFSDLWDVRGERQTLADRGGEVRDRSGAFPFEIPYRLVNMYSTYDDRVLDPFWGTGTTALAALIAGRNSVGYEREPAFLRAFDERVARAPKLSRTVVEDRLEQHRRFVTDNGANYEAEHYEFGVTTKRERGIRLRRVTEVSGSFDDASGEWMAIHEPV